MTDAYYPPQDPHFEIWCTNCRYGHRGACNKEIVIHGGVLTGKYRCACTRCAAL